MKLRPRRGPKQNKVDLILNTNKLEPKLWVECLWPDRNKVFETSCNFHLNPHGVVWPEIKDDRRLGISTASKNALSKLSKWKSTAHFYSIVKRVTLLEIVFFLSDSPIKTLTFLSSVAFLSLTVFSITWTELSSFEFETVEATAAAAAFESSSLKSWQKFSKESWTDAAGGLWKKREKINCFKFF